MWPPQRKGTKEDSDIILLSFHSLKHSIKKDISDSFQQIQFSICFLIADSVGALGKHQAATVLRPQGATILF